MNPHPLIHAELAHQRLLDLRRTAASSRRSARRAPTTDGRLAPVVQAAVRGDGQAWKSLVEQFTPALCGIVRGYRLNAAEIEDVVQAALASAFVNLEWLREPEAVGGWLAVIARREALRTLEGRRREVPVDEPSLADEDDHSGPDRGQLDGERRHVVRAALERLPEDQRRPLRLRTGNAGRSFADVDRQQLDTPVGSIDRRA